MCGGPSQTQLDLQSEEANFYKTQVKAYNNAYSNFSGIQDKLNAQFAPIIAKGPDQFGYSDAEFQNLVSGATEQTAQGYAHAKQALQQNAAAQGGGMSNINMTSGGQAQRDAELAATGEAALGAEKLGITQSGYAKGYDEWQRAVGGEENLAAGWNPNAFSGSAVGAGNSANDMANTITQQQNSIWTSVMGALGGVAGQAAGGWALGKAKKD